MSPARARLRQGVAASLAAVLLLGACSKSESTATPGPTGDVDLAAVRDARELYGPLAQELGSAVLRAAAVGRDTRLNPAPSDLSGNPDVLARSQALDHFEEVLNEVTALAILVAPEQMESDPARAAAEIGAEAWGATVRGAQQVVSAGRSELAVLRELLDAEIALAGIAALWDEAGSRAEQTARLTEAGGEAEDLATILSTVQDDPVCSEAVQRRRDAASLVAERTFELAGFARNGQGRAFDEARAGYDLEPWAAGIPADDLQDTTCWESMSGVPAGAAQAQAGLDALVASLNVAP